MTAIAQFEAQFDAARQLHLAGRLQEAERAYRQLEIPAAARERVLVALTDLYFQARQPRPAIDTLLALRRIAPDSLDHCTRLAQLLHSLGQTEAAIEQYQLYIGQHSERADAHFNVALLYKADLRYRDALAAYATALDLGIDHPEGVYSNMGVLYSDMRQPDKAMHMYERALALDKCYAPALFNLAALNEEAGARAPAIALYKRLVRNSPDHFEARARLAEFARDDGDEERELERLQDAIRTAHDDTFGRECLLFAQGHLLDQTGRYAQAFEAYTAANALGQRRQAAYDRDATETAFTELTQVFSADWVERVIAPSTARPIFICGMFRSGSTLLERMLGAHPMVVAGGELNVVPWLVARHATPYPHATAAWSVREASKLADLYLKHVADLFGSAQHVTDKRPDNFLHLGLIKAMFPRARIIYTRRQPLDNCLSIFFQQLGGQLNYACNLHDAAHYYLQHERLMAHWQSFFGDDIVTVDYDKLVREPEAVLRPVCDALDLGWDPRCLAFERGSDSTVKTASLWQVREPLHTRSSGRWRRYQACIPDFDLLQNLLPPAG